MSRFYPPSEAILANQRVPASRRAQKLKGPPLFPLAFIIFWYAIFLLFAATYGGVAAYEDYLLNAYLWILLGILFRLLSFELSPQFAASGHTASPPLDSNPIGSTNFAFSFQLLTTNSKGH
jgi:hypothetical protein